MSLDMESISRRHYIDEEQLNELYDSPEMTNISLINWRLLKKKF